MAINVAEVSDPIPGLVKMLCDRLGSDMQFRDQFRDMMIPSLQSDVPAHACLGAQAPDPQAASPDPAPRQPGKDAPLLDTWTVLAMYGENALYAHAFADFAAGYVIPALNGQMPETQQHSTEEILGIVLATIDERLRMLAEASVKQNDEKLSRFVHAIESARLHAAMKAVYTCRTPIYRALFNLQTLPKTDRQPEEPVKTTGKPQEPATPPPGTSFDIDSGIAPKSPPVPPDASRAFGHDPARPEGISPLGPNRPR